MHPLVSPQQADPPLILALDIGSSSVRASLFDAAGRTVDGLHARRAHALHTDSSGAAVVDADAVIGLIFQCVDETLALAGPLAGSITASLAYPAYAVYRAELFPTGNRGGANGLITAAALLSGSLGILAVGVWRDHGASFGTLMAVMAVGQLVAAGIAVLGYPETAHLALEEINPGDPVIAEE